MRVTGIYRLVMAVFVATVRAAADAVLEVASVETSYEQLAQSALEDSFSFNVTALRADIITAVKDEMKAFAPHDAFTALQDNNNNKALRDDIKALRDNIEALQDETRSLGEMLKKFVPEEEIENEEFGEFLNSTMVYDDTMLPQTWRVAFTNLTYALVRPDPKGTLANLLATHHVNLTAEANTTLHKRSSTHEKRNGKGEQVGIIGLSAPLTREKKPEPIQDWREKAIFIIILAVVSIYIVSLCCLSARRAMHQPDTKKQLQFWKGRREIEYKARKAAIDLAQLRSLLQEYDEQNGDKNDDTYGRGYGARANDFGGRGFGEKPWDPI